MKTLTTTDIYLASALSALGARLESVDKEDPKHMQFTFSPRVEFQTGALPTIASGQDLESLKLEWTNRTLLVNAADYAEAIKRMKSEVHTK